MGVLIIVGLSYLITRSEKKWKKQTSDECNNLLTKIRSTEIVPPSEFQHYFGNTLSGKINYDGNNFLSTGKSDYRSINIDLK